MKDLTVIIPTLNEEKNVGKLITALLKLYRGVSIIVADDGSTDGTKSVVSKFRKVKFLDRSSELVKGLTVSVMDATLLVKTKYFVVIDGDMQHPPERISEILFKLKECDVVVGIRRRVLGDWGILRRSMSVIANSLGRIRLFFNGVKCRDVMSGYFGARTKLFLAVVSKKGDKFEKKGYKVLFDFLKYVPRVKVCSVYYDFRLRQYGTSKISGKHVLYYLRSLFK